MALDRIKFNIASFNDADAGGNNYYAGIVYEVFNSNDTLADIYSDAAGANPINQDGISNKSNSSGEVAFYIDSGDYYIKVNEKVEYFSTLLSSGALINDLSLPYVFDTVDDMVNSPIIFPTKKKLSTKGYYLVGDGGAADYLTVAPQAFDGYGNHQLDNGNIAAILSGAILIPEQWGARDDGGDYSANLQAALQSIKDTGGELRHNNGTIHLGDLDGENSAVLVDGANNIILSGSGQYTATTKANLSSRDANLGGGFFEFSNSKGISANGPKFKDLDDTLLASWNTGVRRGANAIVCSNNILGDFGDIDINVTCENMLSLFAAGTRSSTNYAQQNNIKVRGYAKTCYYGARALNTGRNVDVDVDCYNVKRVMVSYNNKNIKGRSKLECGPDFLGSNAYYDIVTELTGFQSENIDIACTVRGVLQHTSYITLYHQSDSTEQLEISGANLRLDVDNVTTTGRHTLIADVEADGITFLHENTSQSVVSPTPRVWKNLSVDGNISGITGHCIKVFSLPDVRHDLSVGASMAKSVYQGSLSYPNDGGYLVNFFNVDGNLYGDFTPEVVGTTTDGTANYTVQSGRWSLSGRLLTTVGTVTYAAHTGTGNTRIQGLPLVNTSSDATSVNLVTNGIASTNGVVGLKTGSDQITVYERSTTLSLLPINSSGSFWFDCSYKVF